MTRIIHTRRTASMLALAAALVLASAGCQSTPEEEPEEAPPSEFSDASSDTSGAATPTAATSGADVAIATVYFDFDKSEIRNDAVSGLRAGAVALKESGAKVVVAGHTDNRGSEEYNLALGERRAASVRRYLANLGVATNQMTIVSYGEVRPQVQGNNETAWAKNRRAEFKAVD